MRRAAAVILALSFLAILCSGCFDDVQLPEELEDKVVTVRFWHAMAGDLGDALKELVNRFHQENPGIRVVPIYQGSYGSLSQKIVGAVIAHEPPDVAQVYPAWVSFLNQDPAKPAVLPLDDLVAADPDFTGGDVFDVLLDDCRMNGRLFAMPFNKSFPVLFYNKGMLARAGFDHPPATWDEFAVMARACTVDRDGDGKNDQWGWAFNNDSWIFGCTVLQWGGTLISDDGLSAPFDAPPSIRALQYFVDAAFGPEPFAYVVTGYDHQTDFVDQKVAMIVTSSVSRVYMKDQLRFDYGMAPLPAGVRRAAILSGTNLAIFSATSPERRKAAWEFVKFFSSAPATAYWSMRTSYVPVRRSALTLMDSYLKQDPNARAAIDQLDVASYEPSIPAWYECRQILRNYVQKVMTEHTGVREQLTLASEEMRRKLEVSARNRAASAGSTGATTAATAPARP